MNRLVKVSAIAMGLVFASTSYAGGHKSDSEMLADCRTSVNQQFDNVESLKVAHIKSRRNTFTAKFRVTTGGEKAMVQCTVADEQPVALSCLKGACPADMIAAK